MQTNPDMTRYDVITFKFWSNVCPEITIGNIAMITMQMIFCIVLECDLNILTSDILMIPVILGCKYDLELSLVELS